MKLREAVVLAAAILALVLITAAPALDKADEVKDVVQ